MKTLMLSLVAVALIAASCSSTKQASSAKSDDVYVTQTTPSATPSMGGGNIDASQEGYNNSDQYKTDDSYQSPDYSTSDEYTDSNGTTYVTNNYYGSGGGWYDTQMGGPYFGFNYFSPFYTGFSYYDPFYYTPGFSFSIGFGIGFGYGYGYYNPWYSPYSYYNPYYGYYPYYPYYPYGGYCGGYYGDYYGGSCGGYYSPYYGYYGYRGASASNTTGDDYGGRHYKSEDNSGGSNTGRMLTSGSLNGTLLNSSDNGRNVNGNVVKGQDLGSGKNSGNNGRDNSFENSKGVQHSYPDQNIQQHDVPSMDRNVTSPERGNNNNAPRQNNAQGTPRNISLLSHTSPSNAFASSSDMKHMNNGIMPQMHSSSEQQSVNRSIGNPKQGQPLTMNSGKQQKKSSSQTSSAKNHSSSAFKMGSGNSFHQMSQPQASHQSSASRSYSGGGSSGGQRSSGNQSSRR